MIHKVVGPCFLLTVLMFLFCAQPENPYLNPNNATIQVSTSLKTLTDTLKTSTQYKCSVDVFLPNLVDSFFVTNFDSTILKAAANALTPITFSFTPPDTGAYKIRVIIVKINGSKDSLVKNGYVVALPFLGPKITPVLPLVHLFLGDSVIVKFNLVDADSDLSGFTTRFSEDQDTALSHAQDYSYSITSHVAHDTISRTLKGDILFQGIKSPLICFAQAIDRKNNLSTVAACTVFVADTTHPTITKLRPVVDSTFILPDTIIALVHDNWGIDSVKLGEAQMTLSHDSAVYIVPALAPGTTTFDTIAAWDKAGNRTTLTFTRIYSGAKVYPPIVKNLGMTVFTANRFDTLYLDTCANPTNPATLDTATYQKSLLWQVFDSAGTSLSIPVSKKIVVAVPADPLWNGSIKLTFVAIAPTGPSMPTTALFTVRDLPGTPVITVGNQLKLVGNLFDTLLLDTCAKDSIDLPTVLNWTIKNGKYFKADSIRACPPCTHLPCLLCINPPFNRRIAIVADTAKIKPATWTGSDTLYFTVKNSRGLSKTKALVFTQWSFIIRPPIITTLQAKRKL
jgi:hypothetical protein